MRNLSLLLIDDDAVFLSVMQRALTHRNHSVYTAKDKGSALAQFEQATIDYVILDLKLEHSSGLHVLGEILKLDPTAKVIILTGYSSIATAVEAIKLGAQNYLCKPVNADDLLNAIDGDGQGHNLSIANDPPSVDRLEWEHIQQVLQENQGNISATARALGMHRRTLQRKLQKRPVKK